MVLYDAMKNAVPEDLKRRVKTYLRASSLKPSERHVSAFQNAGEQIQARGLFVGCPLHYFEATSKDLFCLAMMEGLRRTSTVLEVGCGCLRTGYLFIRYLEEGRYHGIEPHVTMLDAGRELILGPLDAEKAPQFSHNSDFRFDTFGRSFDFVVAFSVWSHASKRQIETMLDQFKQTAYAGGRFIASWYPPRKGKPDYVGDVWVGRSNQSDESGTIAHSPEWISQAVAARGLQLRFVDGFMTLNQNWLIVTQP